MGFFKARYVRDYMAARKIKSVFVWAAEIAAVVIAAVVITVGFGKTTVMQEGSMDPTLAAGDVVLINRAAYKIGEPKRGDIIALPCQRGRKCQYPYQADHRSSGRDYFHPGWPDSH